MEQYNDEIQLKDILIKLSEYKGYLLKKKFTIIGFSFLFFMMGVVIAFRSETKYNAELTFVVEGEKGGGSLGSMSGIASQFGFDLGGSSSATFSQSNILELLKSRGVIENTLLQNIKVNGKEDLLIEHYLEINKVKESWLENDNFDGISYHDKSTFTHDSISGGIWKNIIENKLIVELESDEANIITLSYLSLNDEFAKGFVESLIGEMSKMYISHQTAQANNTLDFLQNRADSVFSELEIAEEDFARVKDINQRIVKASGRLKELQLMRRVEVLNTMYLEIVKNLELSKIALLNKTPIINIIDRPILPLVEDKISKTFAGLLGGFLGGFLSVCFFIFRKLFKDALAEA
ncbi:MAG: hypothetical protein H8E84_09105 [Flavobacteriales bacterium]|nr:hypothetical protein [Flavobacteriales bacterium]